MSRLRPRPSVVALPVLFTCAALGCSGEKNVVQSSSGSPAPATTTEAAATSAATPGDSASSSASASATSSGSASSAPATSGQKADDLNVLVLSIDALRADHLEFSGYKDVMPTVNAFEKTAVSYTNFYSLSSFTAQTIGGFLGCRYPMELKRNGSFFAAYPPEETMFPELLQKAGIRTMTANAHFYFQKGRAGFDQGFDLYELVPGIKKNNKTDESITSPEHTELALKQLGDKANTGKRFFAWYHLLDAHDEYKTHPEGKDFGKGALNRYDGELYFVDMHVKKILDFVDAQPWGKKTMVVITSDHGEAFGEHSMYRHAFELWHNLTHVPLMIRAPGAKARRIDEPRSQIDLCPTILDTFGVKPEPTYQGVSLWPEMTGGKSEARDVISELARDSNNDRHRMLVRGDWKIIEFGNAAAFQLFNLKEDPKEENDLSRKNKEKFEEMMGALKKASEHIKEICPKSTERLTNKPKGKPC